MLGFTLYETLRIFLPGAIATAVLDLVLRLAFGKDATAGDANAASLVSAIESPLPAVVLSLALGLLLYLIDLPEKTRLYREGAEGWRVPSKTLEGVQLDRLDAQDRAGNWLEAPRQREVRGSFLESQKERRRAS